MSKKIKFLTILSVAALVLAFIGSPLRNPFKAKAFPQAGIELSDVGYQTGTFTFPIPSEASTFEVFEADTLVNLKVRTLVAEFLSKSLGQLVSSDDSSKIYLVKPQKKSTKFRKLRAFKKIRISTNGEVSGLTASNKSVLLYNFNDPSYFEDIANITQLAKATFVTKVGNNLVFNLGENASNPNIKGLESIALVFYGKNKKPLRAATLIQLKAPQPTQTDEPTPVPTQSQEPTPQPTQTDEPTPVPTQSQEPTPQPTQTDEPTPVPTQSQEPTPQPTQTDEPTPVPTQSQEPTPQPTQTDEPTPVPTQSQEPTPQPTQTAEPTATPEPKTVCTEECVPVQRGSRFSVRYTLTMTFPDGQEGISSAEYDSKQMLEEGRNYWRNECEGGDDEGVYQPNDQCTVMGILLE